MPVSQASNGLFVAKAIFMASWSSLSRGSLQFSVVFFKCKQFLLRILVVNFEILFSFISIKNRYILIWKTLFRNYNQVTGRVPSTGVKHRTCKAHLGCCPFTSPTRRLHPEPVIMILLYFFKDLCSKYLYMPKPSISQFCWFLSFLYSKFLLHLFSHDVHYVQELSVVWETVIHSFLLLKVYILWLYHNFTTFLLMYM